MKCCFVKDTSELDIDALYKKWKGKPKPPEPYKKDGVLMGVADSIAWAFANISFKPVANGLLSMFNNDLASRTKDGNK